MSARSFSCFFPLRLWHDALLLSERVGKMQGEADLFILTLKEPPFEFKGWFFDCTQKISIYKRFSTISALKEKSLLRIAAQDVPIGFPIGSGDAETARSNLGAVGKNKI